MKDKRAVGEFAQMVDSLCDALTKARFPWNPSSSENRWSEVVFRCFEELAAERRYFVRWKTRGRGSRAPAGPGEWLFDLTWSEGDPRTDAFRKLELALECEWGCGVSGRLWPNQIREELNKLLVAACPLRVLVYGTPGTGPGQHHVREALDVVRQSMSAVPGATSLSLLAVLISPGTGASRSCTVQGLAYSGETDPAPIEPRPC